MGTNSFVDHGSYRNDYYCAKTMDVLGGKLNLHQFKIMIIHVTPSDCLCAYLLCKLAVLVLLSKYL